MFSITSAFYYEVDCVYVCFQVIHTGLTELSAFLGPGSHFNRSYFTVCVCEESLVKIPFNLPHEGSSFVTYSCCVQQTGRDIGHC